MSSVSVKTVGSKAMVWHGTAKRTSGRLTKADLMKNAQGRIVSRKKHEQGKVAFKRNKLRPRTPVELEAIRALGAGRRRKLK